jgi:hypothetical protein
MLFDRDCALLPPKGMKKAVFSCNSACHSNEIGTERAVLHASTMRRKTMAKRISIIAALIFIAALSFANGQQEPAAAASGQTITVKGTLTFENLLHPTLKGSDKTYYLLVPRYLPYQAGLKDGAEVTVQGYIVNDLPRWDVPDNALFVTKATINGKDYDLSQYHRGMMGGYGPGMMGAYYGGGMVGGRGPGWGPGARGSVY